jgi:hypothetical protein
VYKASFSPTATPLKSLSVCCDGDDGSRDDCCLSWSFLDSELRAPGVALGDCEVYVRSCCIIGFDRDTL